MIKIAQNTAEFDIILSRAAIPDLKTAVLISLLTDGYNDNYPIGQRKGWWGDAYLNQGEGVGSKLWTLLRQTISPESKKLAIDYAKEALNWLITDKWAESIAITIDETAPNDHIYLNIEIKKPAQILGVGADIWQETVEIEVI
jgi:phage gp46-like protein